MEKNKNLLDEYIQKDNIRALKDTHIYPTFLWSVCLTLGCYLLLALIRDIFPSVTKKILDFLSLFEFFGVGCAIYFFVFWLRTRKIGRGL